MSQLLCNVVISGECYLTDACNCQSCMNETTNEDLPQSLSDNSRRLVQTSDNRTQSVYLSDHARVDTSNQLDTDEDCKQSYSACDTEMQDESGQRRFVGEVCNRKFTKARKFTTRMSIPKRKRRFRCEVCDKKFTCPRDLKRHMHIHTGERPFN